jgi:hypothetical protein
MVPLRALAEKMGAQVDWVDNGNGTATVNLNTYPEIFPLEQSAPADLEGLGASSALTQYLASEQAASLTGNGPAMVRFELLDMMPTCGSAPPADPAQYCPGGFRFGARLYYVLLNDPDPANQATYLYFLDTPSFVGRTGKQPKGWWYEDIILDVKPTGTPVVTHDGGTIKIVYGAQGWTVDPASKVVKQKVDMLDFPYLVHGSYGR